MTLNPADINSMYQLPGFEALFHPTKNLLAKIDTERMKGNVPNMSGVDVFDLSHLPARQTLTVKESQVKIKE